jgi:glucose-1-phosphate adenylyltransferase
MAGGEGVRLRPFTQEQPKPALSFAGGYRIIDFVLSNLYNSMVRSTFVLLQYKPQALIAHLAENWAFANSRPGEFVEPALPTRLGPHGEFKGTADAVRQSLDLLEGCRPDLIAVFAADHVYRMDVRQMVAFHEAAGADVTVAAVPVSIERASGFGVICADAGDRITGFQEKPDSPMPMPGDPRRAYASMGNYLFRPEVLRAALRDVARRDEHDFGRHVLPRLIGNHRVYAYDFPRNAVPGVKAYEEPGYWRDVGTVEAYVAAHWDLLGPQPRFCLDNPAWPIYSGNAPRCVKALTGSGVFESILGPGASFHGASVHRSVLQRGARVEPGATVEHSIIMEGARVLRGVRLQRAIVGSGNVVGPTARIGDKTHANRRQGTVTPAGIVVVPPGTELVAAAP